MQLLVLTFLLVGLSGSFNAEESKSPASSPRADSQPKKTGPAQTNTKSHDDERGTKERPFVVEIIPRPIGPAPTEHNTAKSDNKSVDDKTVEKWSAAINAFASVVVAGFTGFLWWTSRRQWQATSAAANAALATATSLNATERAYVFVNVKPEPRNFPDAIPPRIVANCCNHGKTPAKIGSLHCRPEIVASVPVRLPAMLEEELPEGLVIASDGIYGAHMGWKEPIADSVISQIKRGERFLVCYGFIRYYDIFDEEWETGFCWQYDDGIRRFRISNSPLNYCKKADLHNN